MNEDREGVLGSFQSSSNQGLWNVSGRGLKLGNYSVEQL